MISANKNRSQITINATLGLLLSRLTQHTLHNIFYIIITETDQVKKTPKKPWCTCVSAKCCVGASAVAASSPCHVYRRRSARTVRHCGWARCCSQLGFLTYKCTQCIMFKKVRGCGWQEKNSKVGKFSRDTGQRIANLTGQANKKRVELSVENRCSGLGLKTEKGEQ